MPIRNKPIDIVPILLRHLTEIITDATTQSNQVNSPNQVNSRNLLLLPLEDIKTELEYIKDQLIPRFNRCDEDFMKKLTELETYIADEDFISHCLDPNNEIREKIESIAKEIRKLKGEIRLPELGENSTEAQKKDPLKDEAPKVSRDWLHLTVEENILGWSAMANLQLSYDVLDIQLKLCLLCLAIFPEKNVVKKKSLIYWWIGEGLISRSRDKSAEEVGEGIFRKLIEKGLIQPSYKGEGESRGKGSPIVDGCTIHPWIRRMLIAAAREAKFFDFDATGEIGKINEDNEKSRRACLVLDSDSVIDGELFTIFNVNKHYLSFNAELFSKFKKLVIVQLGRWQTSTEHHIEVESEEFLNEMGGQKHLRYLSLQGISRITALPPSILKCVNLEILDLRACHNLERLPSDIGSLRKLTHLDVSQCFLLESMPKGIEKISSLQVLKGFAIGLSRKNPCKLGDLVQLKKLRKLSIHIGSKAVIDEGELKKLKEIASLRVLTISWGQVGTKKSGQVDTKTSQSELTETASLTMKFFSFPPKLEKLDLRCIPQKKSPEWLKPSNMEELKRLYIRGGELVCLDQEDDKKWKVKILRLKYLKNLKLEGKILQEDFPDLVYFEKIQCHQIGPNLGKSTQYEMNVEWNNTEGWAELEAQINFYN